MNPGRPAPEVVGSRSDWPTGSIAAVSTGGKRWGQVHSPCPSRGVLGNPSMYDCVIVLTEVSALAKQGAFSGAVTAPNQHPAGQPGSGSTPLNKQCSPRLGLRSQGLEADSCLRNPGPQLRGKQHPHPPAVLLSQSGRHPSGRSHS